MIRTIYVNAKSKVEINKKLTAGEVVGGKEYTPHTINFINDISKLPDGTVIKVWDKKDPYGTPIAKSYGGMKGGKVR